MALACSFPGSGCEIRRHLRVRTITTARPQDGHLAWPGPSSEAVLSSMCTAEDRQGCLRGWGHGAPSLPFSPGLLHCGPHRRASPGLLGGGASPLMSRVGRPRAEDRAILKGKVDVIGSLKIYNYGTEQLRTPEHRYPIGTNMQIQRSSTLHHGKERENYITRHPEKRDYGETKKQPAYERKQASPEGEVNEMEASNLSEKEFREIVIRWLKRMEDKFDNMSKNQEEMKKNQEEMKNDIAAVKNSIESIKSILKEAEDRISELEDK
ncbi:hypothetical protein QTO34_003098, partial [Cnephaeus nilssonii]